MMNSQQSARTTPHTQKPRREKIMGEGRLVPLDRNAKARIQALARALKHPTEKGKHYGILTAKFLDVLNALLWGFHNAVTGRCFPCYARIAARAKCNPDTVYEALRALEGAGVLTWVNRYVRVRDVHGVDLFGKPAGRWRYLRTSNQYEFMDPQKSRGKPPVPSKSEFPPGTPNQVSMLSTSPVQKPKNPSPGPLADLWAQRGWVEQGAT